MQQRQNERLVRGILNLKAQAQSKRGGAEQIIGYPAEEQNHSQEYLKYLEQEDYYKIIEKFLNN